MTRPAYSSTAATSASSRCKHGRSSTRPGCPTCGSSPAAGWTSTPSTSWSAPGHRSDGYGIGTKVGVCADAPYLDTAYKLVEYGQRPVFKLSPGKATMPGRKQVFRGPGLVDQIGLRGQKLPPGTEPLLVQVMASGHRTQLDSLADARRRCAADLAQLAEEHRRLRDPVSLIAAHTPELLAYAREAGAAPQFAAR